MAPTIVGAPISTSGKPNSARSLAIDEVAPRHEREPVPEAVAVHRRDHRLEDLPAALERVDGRLLPERALELADRPRAVAQVAAGAERAPRPRDDRHPGGLVVAEAAERVVEAAAHVAVHRVERLGPVVRDRGHVAVELVADRVVHRRPPRRAVMRGTAARARTRRARSRSRTSPTATDPTATPLGTRDPAPADGERATRRRRS